MHDRNAEIKECIDWRACSYTNWYENFHKITLESICIPLPDRIVDYLRDEIIILPKECYGHEEPTTVDQSAGSSFGEDDGDDEEQPEFPEFSASIKDAISQLGGKAFIKTNWKSPKDAFWITAGQTMCCKDITDVYQLLKASGICKEDLHSHNLPIFDNTLPVDQTTNEPQSPATTCNQYLVLKKWRDIHPGTEFRCFVSHKKLIAISPRDWPQYHEYIGAQRVNIVNDIVSLFKEHIKPKFPLFDYTFDVVRDRKDKVYLLDFAPFGEKYGDALAFTWEELMTDLELSDIDEEDEDPEFRYLSSDCGIQPNKRNNYGIPKDIIDIFRASANDRTESPTTDEEQTLDHMINHRLENIFRNQPSDEADE